MKPVIVPRCVRLVLVLPLLSAVMPRAALAQAPSAADGPWSGQVQCVLSAHGSGYQDDQTHTWRITGGPPKPVGVFREWPAVWSVEGRGSNDSTGATWTTHVAETNAAITFAEDSGRIRILSRHGLIDVNGAITVTDAATKGRPANLQEWDFPRIEDSASATTISGTRSRSTQYNRGWRQRADIPTMETCTWNFTRGNAPATTDTGRRAAPPDLISRNAAPGAAPAPAGGAGSGPGPNSGAGPGTPDTGLARGPRGAALDGKTPPTPSTPATAPTRSGTYLVTVTGLISGQSTENSSPVNFDGKGDEIYAAAVVRRYDRASSKVVESSSLQTEIYGDTNNARDREAAGTMSPLGGIQTGDKIPKDMSVTRAAAPQARIFPWLLWQGTLTDGADALIISPSVWESDGNKRVLAQWVESQNSLNGSLPVRQQISDQINGARFGVLNLDPIQTASASLNVVDLIVGIPLLSGTQIFDGAFDRPFGLIPYGVGSMALTNPVVVLTREIIESALNSGNFARTTPIPNTTVVLIVPKPGVIVISFTDGALLSNGTLSELPGAYHMVLQVERLSAAPNVPAGVTSNNAPGQTPEAPTADARPSLVTTTSPGEPTITVNPALLPPLGLKPSVAPVPARETVTPATSTPSIADKPAQEIVTPPGDQPPATLDAAATVPCTVAGPPINYDATPGVVHLTWASDPRSYNSASGTLVTADYKVFRNDRAGMAVGSTSATGQPTVGVTHRTPLDPRQTYTYSVHSRKYTRVSKAGVDTVTENGCWVSRVTVTPPKPQTPVLVKFSFSQQSRDAFISVKMTPSQGETGFLVLGPGLPAEGSVMQRPVGQPAAYTVIKDPPAGSQTWIVAAFWNTPEGRAIDVVGSGLRVTQTIPAPPGPPGPAPTGINVKAFPSPNLVTGSCGVGLVVTWAPVPGATGYTVYSSGRPVGSRTPQTTVNFPYSDAMKTADLARGAVDTSYRNQPEFTAVVKLTVAASFPDKSDGVSAELPLTFSTYPCFDPQHPPK